VIEERTSAEDQATQKAHNCERLNTRQTEGDMRERERERERDKRVYYE